MPQPLPNEITRTRRISSWTQDGKRVFSKIKVGDTFTAKKPRSTKTKSKTREETKKRIPRFYYFDYDSKEEGAKTDREKMRWSAEQIRARNITLRYNKWPAGTPLNKRERNSLTKEVKELKAYQNHLRRKIK